MNKILFTILLTFFILPKSIQAQDATSSGVQEATGSAQELNTTNIATPQAELYSDATPSSSSSPNVDQEEDYEDEKTVEPIISATAFIVIALLILLAFTAGKMSAKHDGNQS